MKKYFFLLKILICIQLLITINGCNRYFALIPQRKAYEFTVVEKFGKLQYTKIVDGRNELDRKGQKPGACNGGENGITILGDENFKTKIPDEIDKHLKNSILDANLFNDIDTIVIVASKDAIIKEEEVQYVFKSSLDQFHIVVNEQKAQEAQACIGGFLGAAIAASIDVETTSDITLTGVLFKGDQQVWRKAVSKHISKIDDYSNTSQNAETSMGEAIGESSKELVTELAKYLSEN